MDEEVTAVVIDDTPAVSWKGQEAIPILGQLVAFATVVVVANYDEMTEKQNTEHDFDDSLLSKFR